MVNKSYSNFLPMKKYSEPFEAHQVFHVWTHANGKDNLFTEDQNYLFFLRKYDTYISPVADTFAYCLMPNHIHFMVRIKSEKTVAHFVSQKRNRDVTTFQGLRTLGRLSLEISRQFSHLFNSYTQAYNKRYSRKGSLFMSNFKRRAIVSPDHFLTLLLYIHLQSGKTSVC